MCGKKNDRGGRNIFIFRSEIGSVTGGIRRHGRIYRFADAIFTDWGYVGLFLSAFVAGSILPFSSEVVLVILVRMGLDPLLCLFAAASGNTLGGMTCYWIGHLGKRDWITRYLRVEPAKIDRVSRFSKGKGPCSLFHLSALCRRSRRHRTRPDAQQCLDYGRCDVRRQIAPLRGDCGCFAGSAFVVLRLSAAGTCVRHGERHISCCVENR